MVRGRGGNRTDKAHLHRIIYRSTMTASREDSPFTREIQSILDWSRIYNPTVGITGALMAGEGHFAQVLEGPLFALRILFGNIACDARHRQVLLLECVPIEERSFADWSMAFVRHSDHAAIPLASLPDGSDPASPSVSAQGVLRLLRYALRDSPVA